MAVIEVDIYVKPNTIPTVTFWNGSTQIPPDSRTVSGEYVVYNIRSRSTIVTLKADGYEDLDLEIWDGPDDFYATMEPIKNYISSITHKNTTYTIKDAEARADIATKQDALPSQSGQSGKFLTTDGSTLSWASAGGSGGTSDYDDLTDKPSINSVTLSGDQTGSDLGLVDAADLEEIDINNLVPDQTGNSGKFLSTNGSTVAWATVQGGGGDSLPDQTGQSGKFLTTNGTTASWANTTAVKFRDWSAS